MSSKKDKFLESAQKFILKGQLDRAIKDYEQVVALDPNDIRHRQRLAELLVRANRKEEAIGEYEAIGKYYGDNAFYLKAIAVYKQIQKLDPDSIKVSYNLAILNEKQGLTGNALAEYSRVYGYYERGGKSAEALEILEKMIAVDPDNLNTRLKFAETHFAAGNGGKAYDDFVQIALLLRKRGDESAFRQVCERVGYLFPDKHDFALELITSQVAVGDPGAVVPELQEMTRKEPGNLKAWQLLADALRSTGDREELKVVYQKMARLFPEELSPREGLVQCAVDDGNTESALFLLKLHAPLYLEKGAYQSLERHYLALLDRMPEDTTLLQGLKGLYEASGGQEKLAAIAARLDSLTRDETEEDAGLQEEDVPSAPAAAAALEDSVREASWDEEIELDLSDEGLGGGEAPPLVEQETAMPGEELAAEQPEVAVEAISDVDLSDGQEIPQELGAEDADGALEVELTEAELMELAGLYDQPGMDEAVSGDIALEDAEEAVQEGLPPDEFLDQLELSEDELIELEAEVLAEIEPEGAVSSADYDKYSLDGLFSAFKRGVDQQLDKEDTETHYNLGIAYKEMGLYDDAVAEFEVAAVDPQRRVDCITLQGICCRDKGDVDRAEEFFRQGCALPGLTAEEAAPLKYELAFLYEVAGRTDDALSLYREITTVTPGFRDTAEKVARLHGEEAQEYYDLDLVELDAEEE